MKALVADLSQLTAQEFGEFIRIVQGRLNGINALRKLVEMVDFKTENNEDVLHELFKKNPWLIDPTFTQFLTSNQSEATVNKRLAQTLQVGEFVPSDYDKNSEEERLPLRKNRRPDLVFLISNRSLSRVVIVELKAPNTPMHGEHLRQLQNYIAGAEAELDKLGHNDYRVEGYLIGSKADQQSKAKEVLWLNDQIRKVEQQAQWKVFDISAVLARTEDAHREMLDVYNQATAREEPEDEGVATGHCGNSCRIRIDRVQPLQRPVQASAARCCRFAATPGTVRQRRPKSQECSVDEPPRAARSPGLAQGECTFPSMD